jgi:hypothetical protein
MSNLDVALTLRLVDRLTAPLRRVGAALGRLGRAGAGLGRALAGVLGPAAALTGALSVGSIVAATAQYANAAEEVGNLSVRLGAGVEELQAYQHAAGLAGIEAGTFNTALQRLNRRMADAAAGDNDDLAALFARAGISLRDANGELRASIDLLPELAELFERNENAGLRTAMAFEMFDSEGVSMLQMLAGGREELLAAVRRFEELGGAISEEAVAAAIDFNEAMGGLEAAAGGLRNEIGAGLLPILTPLVEGLTGWVAANRALIGQRVAEVVGRIAAAIEAVDFRALHDFLFGVTIVGDRMTAVRHVPGLIDRISGAVETVVSVLGGWENAAIAVAVALNANLLVSAGSLGVALGRLLVSIGSLVPVTWAFNAAVLANPLTWIIAGVTAAVAVLAGAAYLLYEHWDDIAAFFEGLWEDVKAAFAAAWAYIEPIVDAIAGAAYLLYEHWDDIAAFFEGLWEDVKAAFAAAWAYIEPIVDAIAGAVERVTGLVDTLSGNLAETGRLLGRADYLAPTAAAGSPLAAGFVPTGTGGYVHPNTGQTWEAYQAERDPAPAPAPGGGGGGGELGRVGLDINVEVEEHRTSVDVRERETDRNIDTNVDSGGILQGLL